MTRFLRIAYRSLSRLTGLWSKHETVLRGNPTAGRGRVLAQPATGDAAIGSGGKTAWNSDPGLVADPDISGTKQRGSQFTSLRLIAAVILMTTSVTIAYAESEIIAESGDWRAFKSDGSCMIGIGSNKRLGLLYFVREGAFALDVATPGPWRFSGDAKPSINIQSEGRLILSRDDGTTKDNTIQFRLSHEETELLLSGISKGTRLLLQFRNSNQEGGWIGLSGSRPVVLAFSRCVAEMDTDTDKADADSSLQNYPAPTFAVTFDAFREALNDKIRKDTLDKGNPDFSTTNICRKAKDSYTCNFHDAGFQDAVANFKKLDVMSGHFTLKIRLDADTVAGKVSVITLSGDRRDHVNLMQFIGTVVNVLQTFDPKVVQRDQELKTVIDELGLMRGNSADDIGKPRSTIEPFAAIECLYQDSNITTHVECRFVPRS